MRAVLTFVPRFAAVLLLVALAACETPPLPQYPDITFGHLQPIRLDVADIDYVQEYVSPQAPPNVEHQFPVSLTKTIERWTKERLQPVGVTRRARVTLINASVVEAALEKKKGLQGLFTTDQSARYDGTLEVRIEVIDDRGIVQGHAQAVARRSRTVPEDITLNERDQIWFELGENMIRALDAELEKTIRAYLAPFVR